MLTWPHAHSQHCPPYKSMSELSTRNPQKLCTKFDYNSPSHVIRLGFVLQNDCMTTAWNGSVVAVIALLLFLIQMFLFKSKTLSSLFLLLSPTSNFLEQPKNSVLIVIIFTNFFCDSYLGTPLPSRRSRC